MTTENRIGATLAAFSTLRTQFESGAGQYHRLCHLLAEGPGTHDKTLGPYPIDEFSRPQQALRTSFPPTEISFRIRGQASGGPRVGKLLGPSVHQFHAFYISGMDRPLETMRHYSQGAAHFRRLSERAGELLLVLPSRLINCYPPEWQEYEQYLREFPVRKVELSEDGTASEVVESTSAYDAILPSGSSGADRWMGYLHWLAWRGLDDLGFEAKRQCWSGRTIYPYFAGRAEFDRFVAMLPPQFRISFEDSRVFYSILEDVFVCSALAINYVTLNLANGPASRHRLFVDDVDSFSRVRDVTPAMVGQYLDRGFLSLSEDKVQHALEEILAVPFHRKDWGGEINDLCTANFVHDGRRLVAAFLLKGPGIGKREMTIADCGKRGDQLVRLFSTAADVFVVQYVGPISDSVVKDLEGKVTAARAEGREARFLVIDGQDTARLLHAYGKL